MKHNWGDYVRRSWFFYVSSFNFKENHVLIEEDNPSEKIVVVKDDGTDRDDIGNLEDLLVLINKECGYPKVRHFTSL